MSRLAVGRSEMGVPTTTVPSVVLYSGNELQQRGSALSNMEEHVDWSYVAVPYMSDAADTTHLAFVEISTVGQMDDSPWVIVLCTRLSPVFYS